MSEVLTHKICKNIIKYRYFKNDVINIDKGVDEKST